MHLWRLIETKNCHVNNTVIKTQSRLWQHLIGGLYRKSMQQFYNSTSSESVQTSPSKFGVSVIRNIVIIGRCSSTVFGIYTDIIRILLKSHKVHEAIWTILNPHIILRYSMKVWTLVWARVMRELWSIVLVLCIRWAAQVDWSRWLLSNPSKAPRLSSDSRGLRPQPSLSWGKE